MRGALARLEWRLSLRRKRLFALNVGVPLLLVVPLALGAAPAFHAAAVYAVLFVLFGTMGSAIPVLRDAESGFLGRVVMTGLPPGRFVVERTAAQVGVDLVQLSPSVILIVALSGGGARDFLVLAATLALALAAANLVGLWVASAARSMAEGALFAAVATLFLLHGSGVFRTAQAGGWGARFEALLPFGPLHRELLRVASGPPGATGTVPGAAALVHWFGPALSTLLLAGISLLAARGLVGRVAGLRG